MMRQIVALLLLASASAFSVAPMTNTRVNTMALFAEEDSYTSSARPVERGVSVDQDGKSNVWAIEPKMEVSSKSNEEKTQSAIVAAGGFGAFAVLAGVVLLNLPDPNQF
ncbi:expressed unknown protein [Seminavis robusta]|uniref:Transmembrane protein n=1 Tax=Seminavis robusta TaxID=568900 RepID=A0A9N8HGD2_9STRA|nr:expressed unknown protein [Seminavis robusta]|eukprot:Sro392_g133370.1 n/a (109) ;mRNA; r:30552-30978